MEAEMAKDYSDRTKALDEIFQRLMVSSGITPANSDSVTVYKGTQREDWAFPKTGGMPTGPEGGMTEQGWGEGINVTPFQYRSPAEQKILGDMFDKLYGHGAQYEQAGAQKANAAANMVAAGAAATNAATTAKEFKFLEEGLKEKRKKAQDAEFNKFPAYEAPPAGNVATPQATVGGRTVLPGVGYGGAGTQGPAVGSQEWFNKRYGAYRITGR
jgi:hypothetical protein